MNRLCTILLLLGLAFFPGCRTSSTSFERLEAVMNHRDAYLEEFEANVDSLKRIPDFEAQFAAFERYFNFNIDSAQVSSDHLSEIASNRQEKILALCARSALLTAHREYRLAWSLLSDAELSAGVLADSLHFILLQYMQDVCVAASNDVSLPMDIKMDYASSRKEVLRNILALQGISPFQYLYSQGKLQSLEGDITAALVSFNDALPICPDDERRIHLYYAIAGCYHKLDRQEDWMHWLIETATLDLQRCHRKYRSLYDLSLALYEDGDYARSERYLQVTLTDALACNFDTRIINAANSNRIVTAALRQRDRQRYYLILTIFFVLVLALVGVMFLMSKINRQRRRLKDLLYQQRELNAQLAASQAQIRESNILKEQYLFRYMLLSAQFVENINDYRMSISHILKNQGSDKAREKLRDVEYIYMQYDSFYRLFDEIFLGVFPDFVQDVNKLLSSGAQMELTETGALSTELRILAVIRLGMNKSGKIARFLNVSPNTVYTYRAALKKASLVGEDVFEERISRIGGGN